MLCCGRESPSSQTATCLRLICLQGDLPCLFFGGGEDTRVHRFVRMGVLERSRYILEMMPGPTFRATHAAILATLEMGARPLAKFLIF